VTTANYGWPYPDQDDEADGAGQIQALADAIDSDLKALADDVDAIPGGGGGGGGGTYVGGRWTGGTTAQSIPATLSGPGTPVALGSVSPLRAPDGVVRSSHGVGHKFELTDAGLWFAAAAIRIASSSAAGEISVNIWADPDGGTDFEDYNLAPDGGRREGLARTFNPGVPTYLPAGTQVAVYVYNGTGGERFTEPNNGRWVHLDLWRVG
jgi:hypothetical protein